jgi:hypothetical protein
MNAKATAAANVPATIKGGKGFIPNPSMANVEAIARLIADETMSQTVSRKSCLCRSGSCSTRFHRANAPSRRRRKSRDRDVYAGAGSSIAP